MKYPPPLFLDNKLADYLKKVENASQSAIRRQLKKLGLQYDSNIIVESIVSEFAPDNIKLDLLASTTGFDPASIEIHEHDRVLNIDGVKGLRKIPFTGDRNLLQMQGSLISAKPPRCTIGVRTILIECYGRVDDTETIRRDLEEQQRNLVKHVDNQNSDIASFVSGWKDRLKQAVETDKIYLQKIADANNSC